jgi:hypothetical protein
LKQRKLQLVILLVLIAVCSDAGVRASTDCEKWVASYKTQLEHAKAVRRIQAANARMKRLAQRKLATYVKKPKPAAPVASPVHFVKPKYTREQMLERFTLLCGDLPTDSVPEDKLLEGKKTPDEFVSELTPWVPFELASTDDDWLIPTGDLPPYSPPGSSGPGGGGGGGGYIPPPIFGGGGSTSSPGGGEDTGGPGGGGGGGVVTPVSDVPEPGSLVLMLTGIAGAAGMAQRRRRT